MTQNFSLHARAGTIAGRPAVLISRSGLPLTAMPFDNDKSAAVWARLSELAWRSWRDDAAALGESFHKVTPAADVDIELDAETDAVLDALARQITKNADGDPLVADLDEDNLRHLLLEVVLHEALASLA